MTARDRRAGDVEAPEPGEEQRAERRGHPFLLAEIDDMQRPARLQRQHALLDRALPVRDHRQRIGNQDAVEAGDAEFAGVKRAASASFSTGAGMPSMVSVFSALASISAEMSRPNWRMPDKAWLRAPDCAPCRSRLPEGSAGWSWSGRGSSRRGRAGSICG